MLILPAIDIRGGKCVRLKQGDYAQEIVFGADPAAMARRWVERRARFLHIVDLDGAREGRPVNGPAIQAIVQAVKVPCQFGGGLRSEDDIAEVLGWGVERVVIGTKALHEPDWLEAMSKQFPGKIVLGIDSREGRVATAGWLELSERPALDLAREYADWPLAALVYTDISRDGMLQGPNFEALGEMARTVSLPVIASGGVSTADDVRRLKPLGLAGCIVGRALYEGRVQLSELLQIAGENGGG